MKSLITLQELCELLKVNHKTLGKEMRAGRLLGTKIGRQWRFTQDAVESYIKSRTIKKAA